MDVMGALRRWRIIGGVRSSILNLTSPL